jgi:hypothetical protein
MAVGSYITVALVIHHYEHHIGAGVLTFMARNRRRGGGHAQGRSEGRGKNKCIVCVFHEAVFFVFQINDLLNDFHFRSPRKTTFPGAVV